MIKKKTSGSVAWIDLESPSREEITEVVSSTGLTAAVAEELLSPSLRHKIEFDQEHAYIVLHFPAFKDSARDDAAYELDFVVGPNYIITVHYEQVPLFEELNNSFHTLNSSETSNPRDRIFFGLLDTLISNFEQKLSDIDHWVRDIERNLFDGKERKTIFELSEAVRHLIDFKKITAVYPEIFNTLEKEGGPKFGPDFTDLSKRLVERFAKAQTKLEMLSETARDLRETNNSLLSTKQNETMNLLTIVFIVTSLAIGAILIWIELSK